MIPRFFADAKRGSRQKLAADLRGSERSERELNTHNLIVLIILILIRVHPSESAADFWCFRLTLANGMLNNAQYEDIKIPLARI
jgi:hypothetical protein